MQKSGCCIYLWYYREPERQNDTIEMDQYEIFIEVILPKVLIQKEEAFTSSNYTISLTKIK